MIWDRFFLKIKTNQRIKSPFISHLKGKSFLAKNDNISLVLFRILFGLLIVLECWGAILTGWVKETFVYPQFTFHFLGFEWTQILLGPVMYFYFLFMGGLGILIGIGFYYRISTVLFTLMWGLVYAMQKSHYNNHYYLLLLISFLMSLVPANANSSIDSRRNKELKSNTCARWHILIFQIQIAIVYFFAAVAKLYPGWIQARPMTIWLAYKSKTPIIGEFLSADWLPMVISYVGIGFDFLIIPLFIINQTRTMALIFALIFHLFNSIVFQIGIFPYFALSFVLFFYPSEVLRRLLRIKKKPFTNHSIHISYFPIVRNILLVYFAFQLIFPIRHWFITGDVLWTEEGHRHSWRMMLRTKQSILEIKTLDKDSGKMEIVNPHDYLKPHQVQSMKVRADMIWQFAQYLKRTKKQNIKIYVNCMLSVNGSQFAPLIDSSIDLSDIKWNIFKHNSWIIQRPDSLIYDK